MQPLTLVFYERLMPGSQLVNRLQDLNYRVLVLNDPSRLMATAQREFPLLLIIDLVAPGNIVEAIASIRSTPSTAHLPIIAFAPEDSDNHLDTARNAGATLAVTETALLNHLSHLIDQALHVD